MRTTLELPEEIMRQVKIRAAEKGRKLKEVFVELLKSGLMIMRKSHHPDDGIHLGKDPKTGLPIVKAVNSAPGSTMKPNELKRLEQDECYR